MRDDKKPRAKVKAGTRPVAPPRRLSPDAEIAVVVV